jgi:hypothetical protein
MLGSIPCCQRLRGRPRQGSKGTAGGWQRGPSQYGRSRVSFGSRRECKSRDQAEEYDRCYFPNHNLRFCTRRCSRQDAQRSLQSPIKDHVSSRKTLVDISAYLSHGVSVSVEETKGVVRATVNRKANTSDVVVGMGRSLGASKRALVVRAADVELVVVRAVRLQVLGLHLHSKVHVGAGEHLAGVHHRRTILVVVDLVLHADWRLGDLDVLLVVMIEERSVSGDCEVRLRVVALRSYAGPEDDAVGVGVTGGDTVSEVQA